MSFVKLLCRLSCSCIMLFALKSALQRGTKFMFMTPPSEKVQDLMHICCYLTVRRAAPCMESWRRTAG